MNQTLQSKISEVIREHYRETIPKGAGYEMITGTKRFDKFTAENLGDQNMKVSMVEVLSREMAIDMIKGDILETMIVEDFAHMEMVLNYKYGIISEWRLKELLDHEKRYMNSSKPVECDADE